MKTYVKTPAIAWRKIEGKAYIVHTRTSMLHECNDVGTFIWKLLDKPVSLAVIAERISNEYEVTREQAAEDAEHFLGELIRKGLIENC